jgi:hypothetical protein
MRKVKIRTDLSDPIVEALVFFALCLEEQLHEYTDDSYKAPALNTFSRTLELQALAQINHKAGIGQDALKPFVEELEWSISKDPALDSEQRELCRIHTRSIREELSAADRVSKNIAGLRISLGNYFDSIKRKILETVQLRPKNKNDLIGLASDFIVQAETIGFPRRHTYHTVRNLLVFKLQSNVGVNVEELLSRFFEEFEYKKKKYLCAFIVNEEVNKFPWLVERYKFQISDTKPEWEGLTKQHAEFIASKKPSERYFISTEEIESHSPAYVHEFGARTFDSMMGIIRYFEHRLDLDISSLALIHDVEAKKTYMIKNPPDPMHCGAGKEVWTKEEVLNLADVVHGYHLTNESTHRLANAIHYHRAALLSNSPENQLVDLWAGLEGLLPQPKRERSRVEFYAESILPALTLTYPEKILRSAFDDTLSCVPEVSKILEDIDSSASGFSTFVSLLLSSDLAGERELLIEKIKVNPLLMNRVWRTAEKLSSRSEIKETLRNHRSKVKWHIERIYATRNSIMHSASALPYLHSLVENLHIYVDTLIRAISRVATISKESLSIEGALQYLSSWEVYRFESLAKNPDASKQLTSDTVWSAVFASEMALAPGRN